MCNSSFNYFSKLILHRCLRLEKLLFNGLIKLLEQYLVDNMIIMGDFNAVLNRAMDKSSKGAATSEIPSSFQEWILNKGVIDCWWKEHLQERNYTFFSNPHGTFSRIDYILMQHQSSIWVLQTKIGLRTFSDHAPVSINGSKWVVEVDPIGG